MRTYQVVAQSNDLTVASFEAADIFAAAEVAGEMFNAEIQCNINGLERHIAFEGKNDYYWLLAANEQ